MSNESKRLGALIPPMNIVVEPEFNRWAPDGITIHFQRMWRSRAVLSPADLEEMLVHIEEDCRRLAFARPHFVMYACTSGSSLETGGFDTRIAQRISRAAGSPASTTSTAVTQALRHLNLKRVAVVTPYPREINDRQQAFFRELDIEPVSLEAFLESDSYKIPMISEEATYDLVKKADRPEADGVFISCTNLPTADIIERLEEELGKPVVTSNQASFWSCLREMGVHESVPGCGQLLREPVRTSSTLGI